MGDRRLVVASDVPVVDGWTLRAWREDDEDAYDTIVCDPSVAEFLGEHEGGPPAASSVLYRLEGGLLYMRAAIVHGDGYKPVGLVEGGGGGSTPDFEFSVGLIKAAQRKGAGRAVVRIVNRLVRLLDADIRVTGVVRRDNVACLGMLQRLGITLPPTSTTRSISMPDQDEVL